MISTASFFFGRTRMGRTEGEGVSCAAVLLVRLPPPLPVLHPGKRGGYNDDKNIQTCLLGFHRPDSTGHISRLSAAQAGELVHRRSHMGSVKIRGASIASADAPQNLNKYKGGSATTCPHCATDKKSIPWRYITYPCCEAR